ncbi:MAG: glycosyltransferase, partial [Clostridia bacterium]|nr:glycosyltransferase [Clostridia bacterium]
QVLAEYNNSTLLFPSYIETYGYPMAEARQMGTLIIASDCPFSREVLEGYKNAYFFDPFDAEALADYMEKIIKGDLKPEKVQEDIKEQKDNSWKQIADTVLACIK